jgi:uncharacterized protein
MSLPGNITLIKDQRELSLSSVKELEDYFGIKYLPQLKFKKQSIHESILRRCEKARSKGLIDRKQRWLSALYREEVLFGYTFKNLIIKWIDETVGFGIFTGRAISPQTFIGEYTGEVRRGRWWRDKGNAYCFSYTLNEYVGTPFLIDAEKEGNLTRFINHSDSPNLKSMAICVEGVMHIILYTIQKIPPGTQLTYDYGTDYWADRELPLLF